MTACVTAGQGEEESSQYLGGSWGGSGARGLSLWVEMVGLVKQHSVGLPQQGVLS